MADKLSQNEINLLLAAINADNEEPMNTMPPAASRKIKVYDFKRPDKFSKEHIRNISMIHESFAYLITTSLSALLRSRVHIYVASVDLLTNEEFFRSLPTPTILAVINMEPLKGSAILDICPVLSFSIIDRLFGGSGEGTKNPHKLTGIEAAVMEEIITRILGKLQKAWAKVIDLQPRLCQIDTNPQFVQIVPPTDMVALVTLQAKVSDAEGMINFCIPYHTVEPIINRFSTASLFGISMPDKTKNYLLHSREDVPVKLTAEMLSRNFSIQEINEWKVDTVLLPLRPASSNSCFLSLGDKHVWHCEILPEVEGVSRSVKILGFIKSPFGTEGVDNMDKVNPMVTNALQAAKMNITVELGAAAQSVKEVFSMVEGTIIELDSLVGEPLDIKANGVLIAKGDVVAIDDKNYGVKIVEITGSHKLKETSSPEPLLVLQQAPVNQEP